MELEKNWAVSLTLPVLWGDMDAFEHVNNVRYFRWFESARIEYFHQLKLKEFLTNKGVGPILAHTSCNYLQALTFPDTIEVKARVCKIGSTSFTQDYLITSNKSQQPVATGQGVIVMIDYVTGKKIALSDETIKRMNTLEQA